MDHKAALLGYSGQGTSGSVGNKETVFNKLVRSDMDSLTSMLERLLAAKASERLSGEPREEETLPLAHSRSGKPMGESRPESILLSLEE